MIAYTVVTKLLMYPTAMSSTCGRDLLFPAALSFLVEGIVIWSLSYLCSKTDKTFFELLEGTIGNIGARIVLGLFALFFTAASIVPLFEQEQYVHNIFYDTVPSLATFLPFFVFGVYAASRKIINVGRSADICLPIFAVCMAGLFLMAFSEVKWNNLMPVLKTPAKSLLGGFAGTALNFAEPCWLLMFMGRFKYKKGDAARITLSYAGGAAIMLLFLAVFYGIYGEISPSRTFAVARTSLFFPAIDTVGRIDLILLMALEIVMLFAAVLNIQLAVYALSECTGYKNLPVLSVAVNAVLTAIIIFCDHSYNDIYEFYFSWAWIVFLIFTIIIPLLCWTLKRRKRA